MDSSSQSASSTTVTTTSTVQQVTKASSDRLLSKFAELDSDTAKNSSRKLQLVRGPIRRKRPSRRAITATTAAATSTRDFCRSVESVNARKTRLAEWNSLLPTTNRRSSLLRQVGVAGRSGVRVRDISGIAFILEALEKTWRKTIKGASKMLVERHRSSHVQLISDVV